MGKVIKLDQRVEIIAQDVEELKNSGGGGTSDTCVKVETDGTNYWITVNGIRLYFAPSAPTGDIPDGSYGLGW